jgi:hypothetical protein
MSISSIKDMVTYDLMLEVVVRFAGIDAIVHYHCLIFLVCSLRLFFKYSIKTSTDKTHDHDITE